MSDGKILSEKSYEYAGPVAECKKGGGGGGSTEYVQSPEARQVMQLLMPTIQRMGVAGQYGGVIPEGTPMGGGFPAGVGGKGGGVIGAATEGIGGMTGAAAPSGDMSPGLLWGPGSYDVPTPYGIPDITGMMPTSATMGAIAPEVRAGVMAPYVEASQQLGEQLATYGGSARGGMGGSAAAGLGRFWGDVGQQYGRDLWSMVQPAQQAGWQAELGRGRETWGAGLGRARDIWGQEQMAKQFPYTAIPGMFGASMPSPVVQQGGGKK